MRSVAPYDLIAGGFRRPRAASSFLSDQKATKESPGDGSGEHQMVLLVARPPGPPFTGELGSETRRNCTGAGWPLTPCLSPARCHCAAKAEGGPCYPFRRASPGAPPWCGGHRMAHPCRARPPGRAVRTFPLGGRWPEGPDEGAPPATGPLFIVGTARPVVAPHANGHCCLSCPPHRGGAPGKARLNG